MAAETKGVLRMEPSVSPWYVDMGVVAGGSGSSAYIDSASAAIGATSASGASAGNSLSAPFFGDMLTAFETWLDFGGGSASASLEEKEDMLSTNAQFPLYLPIILQVFYDDDLSCSSDVDRLHHFIMRLDTVVADLPSKSFEFTTEIYF